MLASIVGVALSLQLAAVAPPLNESAPLAWTILATKCDSVAAAAEIELP